MRLLSFVSIALGISVVGCSGSDGGSDSSVPVDAHVVVDASAVVDASSVDAADATDAHVANDAASPVDAHVASDAYVCEVGGQCNDSNPCPEGWRCYGFGDDGFCAPFSPECGGFVMTECEAGLTCLRGGGSSLGYCATFTERSCICTAAEARGFSVDGC